MIYTWLYLTYPKSYVFYTKSIYNDYIIMIFLLEPFIFFFVLYNNVTMTMTCVSKHVTDVTLCNYYDSHI